MNKKTAMTTSTKILLGVGGVFVFTVIFLIASYITAFNKGNKLETLIEASWTNNKNILSNYFQKVEEIVQVPDMYKNDFKELINADMSGRYGKNGSQATFQFFKERNLTFDASIYKKIQQVIEAGRNEFQNAQTTLIDKKRIYKTSLGSFWTGTFMRVSGYPRVSDWETKWNILIAEKAANQFETGVAKSMTLRPTKG